MRSYKSQWNLLPTELCDITKGCMRMEGKGGVEVNNINVKNVSYLDCLYYFQEMLQNPFSFSKVWSLCQETFVFRMDSWAIVFGRLQHMLMRFLWGHWMMGSGGPSPSLGWAVSSGNGPTSDCPGHPHQERGNCCAFQSGLWRRQGSKARETLTLDRCIVANLSRALASSFAYSNGHYPQAFLFAPEVSTCFWFTVSTYNDYDFGNFTYYLFFLHIKALYKQEEPNSLLFTHQSLGRKQQHNWNLLLKCVCVKYCRKISLCYFAGYNSRVQENILKALGIIK